MVRLNWPKVNIEKVQSNFILRISTGNMGVEQSRVASTLWTDFMHVVQKGQDNNNDDDDNNNNNVKITIAETRSQRVTPFD